VSCVPYVRFPHLKLWSRLMPVLPHKNDLRLLRFENDVPDSDGSETYAAQTDYVTARSLVPHFSSLADGYLRVEPFEVCVFDPSRDWNDKKILIHRIGGAGDLLFITPLIHDIKTRWPRCSVFVHCKSMYHWVFHENREVEGCLCSPLTRSQIDVFDAHICLEDIIEYNPLAKTKSIIDVYAGAAGIELSSRCLNYAPPEAIVRRMRERFPLIVCHRIGISWRSSSPIRDYPQENFLEIIRHLMLAKIQVVLFGNHFGGIKQVPLFIDTQGVSPKLTWEESTAFMSTCNVIVGPDSSAIHFAGAMGIPALGIYGSFPSRLRIDMQLTTQAIEATGPCAPCFHHVRHGRDFPENGPCLQTGRCEVLASIKPQQILDRIFDMLQQKQEEPSDQDLARVKVL